MSTFEAMTQARKTDMIHLSCSECEMSATGVNTAVFLLAWDHHMEIHEPDGDWQAWTWQAVSFPF